MSPVTGGVDTGMPALRGGLKEGDLVKAVEEQPISGGVNFTEQLYEDPAVKRRCAGIERTGQPMHLSVTAAGVCDERGATGIQESACRFMKHAYRRVAFGESIKFAAMNR